MNRYSKIILILFLLLPFSSVANEKIILTVVPPINQITISPGGIWQSNVKVVNSNDYDLEAYAYVMDFEPQGEEGQGRFRPVLKESDTITDWIGISKKPILIPRGESKEVPFTLRVPKNAPPGGHYAGILIGNQPRGENSGIQISSLVSSLLLIRVEGEVQESGFIRELITNKRVYGFKDDINLSLRFENSGNVHIKPQGVISIFDMFGNQKGVLQIGDDPSYGNVLPNSIRKFDLGWNSHAGLLGMGRYKAIATINYGDSNPQTENREAVFWIIEFKPLLMVIGGFLILTFIIIFTIRSYTKVMVRKYKNVDNSH